MACRLALALLLGLLCAFYASGNEDGVNLKDGDELGGAQLDAMPDMDDKATRLKLKCGVCKSSVMEMIFTILKKETDESRKLSEVEVVEILESTCTTGMSEYGLMLDEEGKPTPTWVKDIKVLKAKGGWVTRLAQNVCNDVYNDFDEYLVENAPKTCTIEGNQRKCQAQPLVRHICQAGLKVCPIGSFPEEYDTEDSSLQEPAADGITREL